MPQEPKSSVEMIMNERIRHYERVEGTPRFACYDRQKHLIGYYDTETGKVYDANEKYIGLGLGMLSKISAGR